jgi:hypothetical protein
LDGEGKPARQDQYRYYSYQFNLQQSEYFIYSSVLGKLLTEVNSNGTKKRTFVYGMEGVIALQSYSGTAQEVRWEHTDPGNASYSQTGYNGLMYYGSRAEFDPLGSNVGLSNPNAQQSKAQNAPAPSWGYGTFGDPFGSYSCRMDGFEVPCSMVMQALSVGVAVPDRNFNQAINLGYWRDEDDFGHMNDGFPGVITRFYPFPYFGGSPFGQQTSSPDGLLDFLKSVWNQYRCDNRLARIFGDEQVVVGSVVDPTFVDGDTAPGRPRIGLYGEDPTKGIIHIYSNKFGTPRSGTPGFVGNLFVPQGALSMIGKPDAYYVDGERTTTYSNIQVRYASGSLSRFGYNGNLVISFIHAGPISSASRKPTPIKSNITNSAGSVLIGTIGADGSPYDGGGGGGYY